MSHLILEHLTRNELPMEWAKPLPAGDTFSVMIVPERFTPPPNTPALNTTKTPTVSPNQKPAISSRVVRALTASEIEFLRQDMKRANEILERLLRSTNQEV